MIFLLHYLQPFISRQQIFIKFNITKLNCCINHNTCLAYGNFTVIRKLFWQIQQIVMNNLYCSIHQISINKLCYWIHQLFIRLWLWMEIMSIYVLLLYYFSNFLTIIIHLRLRTMGLRKNFNAPPCTKAPLKGIQGFLRCLGILNEGKNIIIYKVFYASQYRGAIFPLHF